MTPQLEVLKHLGHANFHDSRSVGLKRFFHLLLFGMMVGMALDEIRRSYMYTCTDNTDFGGIAIFSPKNWNNSVVRGCH